MSQLSIKPKGVSEGQADLSGVRGCGEIKLQWRRAGIRGRGESTGRQGAVRVVARKPKMSFSFLDSGFSGE